MTVKSLLVKIGIDTSEFESGMAKAKNTTDDFKKVGMGMTAVGGLIVGALGLMTKEAISSEAAQDKLRGLLERMPGAAKGGADGLIKYAQQLQQTTGIEDDEIISAQAMLATFGLNERQIAALTPRILDMATAKAKATGTDRDLIGTAEALGRAVNGHVAMLGKQGVVLSENTKKTGDFRAILGDLDAAFGGEAVRAGERFSGQVKIAEMNVKDIMKAIGSQLIPVLLPLIQHVGEYVKKGVEWADSHKELLKTLVPIVAGAGALLAVLGPIVFILPKLLSGVLGLGKGLIFLATNPIALVVAAAAVAVGIFFKLQDAIEAADEASARYDGVNKKLADKLKLAADAAGMSRAEFAKLTEKYNDNSAALGMAIEKGKEGKALQEALVAVGKKHGEVMDKEREAYLKANPALVDFNKNLGDLGIQQDAVNTKIEALRKTLSSDIRKATQDDYEFQRYTLAQELIDRQKQITTEVADEKKRSALMILEQTAYNAKLKLLEKTEQEKRFQDKLIFRNKIRDEELQQKAFDIQISDEILAKKVEVAGLINQATMSQLEFKRWEIGQEKIADAKKIEDDLTLTRKQKDDLLAIHAEYYAALLAQESDYAILSKEIEDNLMSSIQTIFGNFSTNTMDAFKKWGEGTGTILTALGSVFKSFASDALKAVQSMISGIISQTIKLVAAKQIAAIASVIASVFASIPFPFNIALAIGAGAAVSAMFGALHLAEGGVVTGPTFALIGEAGPEAVIPLGKAGKMGIGGGIQIHMTNHFHGDIKTDTDIEAFSAKMGLKIQQAVMRGRRGF